MQREQRELERNAHGQESEGGEHRAGALHRGQALPHVHQVERAGHQVEQADADHDEGGADGAHDQVLVGRDQRAAVTSQGDQHVGGERRDLQEHEDVERVAGDGDAQQAG
ncbi:hypothetical protein FQZ97_880560 [compost metagenome]